MIKTDPYSIFYLGEKKGRLITQRPSHAQVIYKNFRIDLLTGEKTDDDLESFVNFLDSVRLQGHYNKPHVFHLSYELGHYLNDSGCVIPEDCPLAFFFVYEEAFVSKRPNAFNPLVLKEVCRPSFETYNEAFEKGRQHLEDGDCYQFNLTFPFEFELEDHLSREFVDGFFSQTNKLGAYAHATMIPSHEFALLSNSPECLFQVGCGQLWSMPIKGTVPFRSGEDFDRAWGFFENSKKETGELNMITDLIRNDLSKASGRPSRVVGKRLPLRVPGILHQFSLITTDLSEGASLGEILRPVFPGGSVTGAPKKRVMQILQELEQRPRSFYCGSTVLLFRNISCGSINIRTAEVDLKTNRLTYHAGGGITLLSDVQAEFDEMIKKVDSFCQALFPGRNEDKLTNMTNIES